MRVALLLAALWSPLVVAACCATPRPRVVPVHPPPCLSRLAPEPPASEDAAAWGRYHVQLEAWSANVERACGSHLLTVDRGDAAPEEEGAW